MWSEKFSLAYEKAGIRPPGWRGASRESSVPFTFAVSVLRIGLRMNRELQTGEFTLSAAIRRYFDVSLYLLIFTGFGTLASTGRLDFPTVLVVTLALLFRGYILARRRQVLLSERWTNVL